MGNNSWPQISTHLETSWIEMQNNHMLMQYIGLFNVIHIYIYLSLSLPLSHSFSTCPRLLLGNNMTCNFCFRPIVLNHALWSTDAPRLCALQGNNGPLLKVRPWSVLPQHEFERLSDAFCGLSAPKPTQVLGYLVVPFSAKKWPIQF